MVAIYPSIIQHYSTEGGPGIRPTVFLIGCNLRCAWCSNPELMLPYSKLLHFSSPCRGRQSCMHAYPVAVYMEDDAIRTRPRAQHMVGELEEVCPSDVLEQVGMQVECQQLVKQLEKDFTCYGESGGDVAFSGGKPLLQAKVLADIPCLLKQKHIATCIDTAGGAAWEHMKGTTQYCGLFLHDIKAFDATLYKEITEADSGRIPDSAGRPVAIHKPTWIRMAIVKGYSDDRRNLRKRLQSMAPLGSTVQRVELLPYRVLREGKYKNMELAYPTQGDACPGAEMLAYYMEEGQRLNLPVYMGKM